MADKIIIDRNGKELTVKTIVVTITGDSDLIIPIPYDVFWKYYHEQRKFEMGFKNQ